MHVYISQSNLLYGKEKRREETSGWDPIDVNLGSPIAIISLLAREIADKWVQFDGVYAISCWDQWDLIKKNNCFSIFSSFSFSLSISVNFNHWLLFMMLPDTMTTSPVATNLLSHPRASAQLKMMNRNRERNRTKRKRVGWVSALDREVSLMVMIIELMGKLMLSPDEIFKV